MVCVFPEPEAEREGRALLDTGYDLQALCPLLSHLAHEVSYAYVARQISNMGRADE
jgi:hypothetical protein